MDFAKKLLEKYGWKEGGGLGKNGSGISKPIKAILKFDNAGLGLDPASEFTNQWWEKVYNDAANNIEIRAENDIISVEVKDVDGLDINVKSSKKTTETEKYKSFLKTSVLTSSGSEIRGPNTTEIDLNPPVIKILTDEELLAACEGRTGHKGARHGLKLSGKLARIEQQNQYFENKIRKSDKNDMTAHQSENSFHADTSLFNWQTVSSKKKSKFQKNTIPSESNNDSTKERIGSQLHSVEYINKSKKKKKKTKKVDDELSDCVLKSLSVESEKSKELHSLNKRSISIHKKGQNDCAKSINDFGMTNSKTKKKKTKKKRHLSTDVAIDEANEVSKDSYRSNLNEDSDEMLDNAEVCLDINISKDLNGDEDSNFTIRQLNHSSMGISNRKKTKSDKKLKKRLQRVTRNLEKSML